MFSKREGTTSLWMQSDQIVKRRAIDRNIVADVCVVGAGIAGLTAAYNLTLGGLKVVVLEAEQVGSGQSSRSTAQINTAHDDTWTKMKSVHGEDVIRKCAASYLLARDSIQSVSTREEIECNFELEDGYLFNPPDKEELDLSQELKIAQSIGLNDVNLIDRAPLVNFNTGPCLKYSKQAQFHPLKYLEGLASAIERRGSYVFCRTPAAKLRGGKDTVVQTTDRHTVSCDAIIVSTNVPFNDRVIMQTKLAAYRSYVLGFSYKPHQGEFAQYWDTLDPYHYVRFVREEQTNEVTLLVGGEDHKTGQEHDLEQRLGHLEDWARERFPNLRDPMFTWSGQTIETSDGFPYIGLNPADDDNVFIATGDSGMGITHGAIAGIILSDLIQKKENDFAEIYSPSRVSLHALDRLAKENINTISQYSAWLHPSDHFDPESLAPGEGCVLQSGLSKMAISKDRQGILHKRSAVCPHLGGVVQWNSLEQSWDCPCHGSRFSSEGEVLCGPSTKGLAPSDEAEAQPAELETAL